MTAGKRATVKVRWERGGLIGPWMTPAEAEDLVEQLERAVVACGDGPGFVSFRGFDGRAARIRGREVITIECLPEVSARLTPPVIADRPAQTLAPGGPVPSVEVAAYSNGVGQQTPGTRFLREQVARQHANGARR